MNDMDLLIQNLREKKIDLTGNEMWGGMLSRPVVTTNNVGNRMTLSYTQS